VASAVVLLISGCLSGVIGRKRFYMLCVATFTGSSILCALAPTYSCSFFFACCGPRRRRHGAERAGHAGRHVSGEQALDGFCSLLVGPDYRPDARRLAYRQSLLALDFPHQRSDRGALARPGELARDRTGSAAA
jgi:hypothetical protein